MLVSTPKPRARHALAIAALALVIGLPVAHVSLAGPIEDRLEEALGALDAKELRTGVLLDRVLPFAGIERFSGEAGATVASRGQWRQVYEELRRASASPGGRPNAEELIERARQRQDVVPLTLLFDDYERIRPNALDRGALELRGGRVLRGNGEAFERRTAFVAAALREWTHHGEEVRFVLERDDYYSNRAGDTPRLEADLDDGAGFRALVFDVSLTARYVAPGAKTLRLRATTSDGEVRDASFTFTVRALAAPTPNDTISVTGTVPHLGGVASGHAYVYLAAGHGALVNPIVAVEGFDLDNTANWDELYEQFNQQQLVENLRADGYDIVVLNFTDATDYVQRNAFVLVELLQRLRAALPAQQTLPLAGASMGGLVCRYALAYMENHGLPHGVRTFLSFDAPHQGANIPLGVQYWVRFFASQSSEAAFLLSVLNRPAARQLLVYHYVYPLPSSEQPDPLRTAFLADLAALGDWPQLTRRVAVANGSDHAVGQGFAPAEQIIKWSYTSFLVNVRGHVWAVSSGPNTKIFDGRIRILLSAVEEQIYFSGTEPFDGAPGGSRATLAEMDAVPAPYGDIVAPYPSHCFIPTVSALGYTPSDLFHDIASDLDPRSNTPFDAIYAQPTNQGHVTISPEVAAWIRNEFQPGVTAVDAATARPGLKAPMPNPSAGPVRVAFRLDRPASVDLRVFGVDGREVATLARGTWDAGNHEVAWSGRDARGTRVRAGVYVIRYAAGGVAEARRVVRLK